MLEAVSTQQSAFFWNPDPDPQKIEKREDSYQVLPNPQVYQENSAETLAKHDHRVEKLRAHAGAKTIQTQNGRRNCAVRTDC